MREAAAKRRGPAESPRRRRSGLGCWGDQPGDWGATLEGDGTRSALNSRDVNSSHSSDRAKWGALLCRAANDTASATRSCKLMDECASEATSLLAHEDKSTSNVRYRCHHQEGHWQANTGQTPPLTSYRYTSSLCGQDSKGLETEDHLQRRCSWVAGAKGHADLLANITS